MIKSLNPCCYYNLYTKRFYLKVKNTGNLIVNFILQYSIYGGTATKQSKFLNNVESDSLFFQMEATNICFNILNYSLPNIPLIYHNSIYPPKNICYEINGTIQNPHCIEIPC